MINVLITGGLHAFAQRVARTLPTEEYAVTFGDAQAIPELMLHSGKYLSLPFYTRPTFSHEMLKLALAHSFEIIVPLMQGEIIQLAESKVLFEEYGIQVAVPLKQTHSMINFLLNPAKELQPTLVLHGKPIGEQHAAPLMPTDLSGVCVLSDSAQEALFCCLR